MMEETILISPQSITVNLLSTRANTSASGTIQVRLGFVRPESVNHALSFDQVYEELLRRAHNARTSLVSAPPASCPRSYRPFHLCVR